MVVLPEFYANAGGGAGSKPDDEAERMVFLPLFLIISYFVRLRENPLCSFVVKKRFSRLPLVTIFLR